MRTLFSLPIFLMGSILTLTALKSQAEARVLPTVPKAGNRTFNCTLGHAIDIAANKPQIVGDVHYEGAFPFALFLPARPARYGALPSPTDDPEPVDPAVRILADPANLAADMNTPFSRVVDLWPERVEMIGQIPGTNLVRFIVISDVDLRKGTAQLFMTRAADAASLDLDNIYQGKCRVHTASPK